MGTLLGVVLGAFLNRISRIGRVKFYINKIECSFPEGGDGYGGFFTSESLTPKTNYMSITIDIDIINTSEFTKKILRDIKFTVVDKGFNRIRYLKDNSALIIPNRVLLEDDLKFINLQPKEIRDLKFSVHFSDDLERVLNSKWYLEYKNPNNRIRRIKIERTNHGKQ